MVFPTDRPRRLRRTEAIRALVRETELAPRHLIAPLFVKEGLGDPAPISSMPGQVQHTLESLRKEARELVERGIRGLILFGIPARKDGEGTGAWEDEGIIQRALRALRAEVGNEAVLTADLCLCEYTEHGHCGVLAGEEIDNDETLVRYARIAASQAAAGADVIAPSGMMDGQVRAIREALDTAGFADTAILAYAAKYASGLYGPFREAGEGVPTFGDRRSHQMDPANAREALREVRLDLAEGADMVMVKPALAYLDVIGRVKEAVDVPVAAYNVSGEYAMVKAAAAREWLEETAVVLEILTAIRRAGADMILTYFAREAADLL